MEAWPGTSTDDRDQEDDSRFSEGEAPRSGAGSTHAPFSPGARPWQGAGPEGGAGRRDSLGGGEPSLRRPEK